MKRIIGLILSIVMLSLPLTVFSGCSTPREEVLKIRNVGEYMDEEIFAEFEQWYYEETGKNITVEASEFITLEQLVTEIEIDQADYDLICPSEYTVEHMIKKDLLLKVDKSVIDVQGTNENGDPLFKSEYLDIIKRVDENFEYAVPYLYGTFGIMYDYSKTGEHIDSWEAIYKGEYNGKSYVKKSSTKKSLREAFISANIFNHRELLKSASKNWTDYGKEYKAVLDSIYGVPGDDVIASVKKTLVSAKKIITKWDEEDVKFSMSAGTSAIEVALVWSCDAGYVMNDYEDNNGNEQTGNRNLWYAIPREGGNVYVDSFVIPKYAKNVPAANMFMKFLCQEHIAVANSWYSGSISPVTAAYDSLYEEYCADESLYESEEGWRDMFIDMMFPSSETLARCGVMQDYAERERAVATMWSQVVE